MLFVRKGESLVLALNSRLIVLHQGPYASAVLRFEITFPPSYPKEPPVIRFITDIFHPLVTPVTTYTYASGPLSVGSMSDGDGERLPPGGFGLRYGFPHWFEKRDQSVPLSKKSSRNADGPHERRRLADKLEGTPDALMAETTGTISQDSCSPSGREESPRLRPSQSSKPLSNIANVLSYMKRAFDDAETLDSIPLEVAVNPGAWKAWQAHRRRVLKAWTEEGAVSGLTPKQDDQTDGKSSLEANISHRSKQPEEWNWDGVWQERVHNGINASISDPVLYSTGVGDEPVRLQLLLHLGYG